MITIQQTVDIPAHPKGEGLRLTINIPPEVPAGTTSVLLVFPSAESGTAVRAAPAFAPFPTLEELKAEAARKTAEQQAYFDATGKDRLVELRDSMDDMPFAGIDGVEYQRKMRDEWPD